MPLDEDVDGELGPLDEYALDEIRTVFETQEPLVDTAGFTDLLDPQELTVLLDEGLDGAADARFDVRWYRLGYYSFHYTDAHERDLRWDYHPKDGAPDKHFHPPPVAERADPVQSCITVEQPDLVARAVHKLWRRAFDSGRLYHLNTADNPP